MFIRTFLIEFARTFSRPKTKYYLYNITLKQGKGIEVYRNICETYSICVYNVSTLKNFKK